MFLYNNLHVDKIVFSLRTLISPMNLRNIIKGYWCSHENVTQLEASLLYSITWDQAPVRRLVPGYYSIAIGDI